MADLAITAANVQVGASPTYGEGIAGAAIAAGKSIFIDTTDANKIKLTDADAGVAVAAKCDGISLHAAEVGQPIKYQKTGEIMIGATLAVGTIYITSDTPGGIRPVADVDSGDVLGIIGWAKDAATLKLGIQNTGITVA